MAKKSLVAIAKGEDIQANVTKVFDLMGGVENVIRKNSTVVLKPNAGHAEPPETSVCTNPEVVRAVIREIKKAHPKKIIIDVYDVLDPISPKDVDNLMDKKVFVMRYKNAASAKRYLTRMADDIAKRAAEKNEEKFVQMLNAVEWSDTALRRMLPAMEESELQMAKAYILEKIRTKETFEI